MTDEELVKQALAELGDVVRCRCHECYTGRGLHDPDCQCDSADALATVEKHIEAMTEQLEAARADAKEAEAYAEELEEKPMAKTAETNHANDVTDAAIEEVRRLEAKLAENEVRLGKAVEVLHAVVQHDASTFFGPDGEKNKRASWRVVMRKVKALLSTIAALKGESHE